MQRDREMAVFGEESWQVWRDVLASERCGRGHKEVPGGALGARGERILSRAQFVEEAVTILVKGAPFGRERHLARRALEEFHAQTVLQLVDTPPDHRRGNALLARGRREAAALGDFDESGEFFKSVHAY